MLSKNCLKDYLLDLHEVLESLDLNQVVKIAEILFTAAKSGKRVYVFGNGDSATNSLHLAADLSKTSSLEGLSLKIYSLVNNVPLITAWANDSSYESIFVEQLKNFLEEVYVVLNKRSFDNKIFLKYRLSEIVDSVDQILHPTIRESLKFLNIKGGVEIGSLADIPAYGTGLGSSSSFLVGVLNALYKYIGTDASAKILAENSCKIEIDTLKEPIGKQDQYCAAYGGFNLIKFYKG